jgi:ATP-dependent Lon protease
LKRVIVPRENEPDLSELPEETRNELEFVLVDNVREVLDAALDGGVSARPRPAVERQAASGSRRAAAASGT